MYTIMTNTEDRVIGLFEEQFQENEQFYFYQDETSIIRFLKETHSMYEMSVIEETILQDIYNYTYTEETGFTYVEPKPEPEPIPELTEQEKIKQIEQAYRDRLAQEVSNNGYNA